MAQEKKTIYFLDKSTETLGSSFKPKLASEIPWLPVYTNYTVTTSLFPLDLD